MRSSLSIATESKIKTQALPASGSASSWTTISYASHTRITNESKARSSLMRREMSKMLKC